MVLLTVITTSQQMYLMWVDITTVTMPGYLMLLAPHLFMGAQHMSSPNLKELPS